MQRSCDWNATPGGVGMEKCNGWESVFHFASVSRDFVEYQSWLLAARLDSGWNSFVKQNNSTSTKSKCFQTASNMPATYNDGDDGDDGCQTWFRGKNFPPQWKFAKINTQTSAKNIGQKIKSWTSKLQRHVKTVHDEKINIRPKKKLKTTYKLLERFWLKHIAGVWRGAPWNKNALFFRSIPQELQLKSEKKKSHVTLLFIA